MVSWKSADESIKDVTLDDYVLRGQVDAIDTVRDLLGVEKVHTIGYCVAGTTLAATLALLAARGQADKVASATFFTAQVDFAEAGDLRLFLGDETMGLLGQFSAETGSSTGAYGLDLQPAARPRSDLELRHQQLSAGQGAAAVRPAPLERRRHQPPAGWHRDYLETLYKGNKLVEQGGISVDGTPIDLDRIETPLYIQAGREDHIAPPQSVWKIMDHVPGPKRFVLAGSGHIAGVVNPPSAGKYQYWLNEGEPEDLDAFIEGATEHKGSWWPDWLAWLTERAPKKVAPTGARVPGKGKLKAIEDAPGRYVRPARGSRRPASAEARRR